MFFDSHQYWTGAKLPFLIPTKKVAIWRAINSKDIATKKVAIWRAINLKDIAIATFQSRSWSLWRETGFQSYFDLSLIRIKMVVGFSGVDQLLKMMHIFFPNFRVVLRKMFWDEEKIPLICQINTFFYNFSI